MVEMFKRMIHQNALQPSLFENDTNNNVLQYKETKKIDLTNSTQLCVK